MCEYSQKEFEEGLASLGCDSIDKLRAKLPQLRAELQASRGCSELAPRFAACNLVLVVKLWVSLGR